MGEHLAQTDKLCIPRQMRFPDHFIDDIQALVNMLIKDITDRYIKVGLYPLHFLAASSVQLMTRLSSPEGLDSQSSDNKNKCKFLSIAELSGDSCPDLL